MLLSVVKYANHAIQSVSLAEEAQLSAQVVRQT